MGLVEGFALTPVSYTHLDVYKRQLEYHVPAITTQPGLPGCADESQVWAFRGPEKSIKDVARRLLGPEV